MKRLHLIISGDVQGVGFRAWVRQRVQNTSITGWVKNCPDKTVEILAEGLREDLDDLRVACDHGPDLSLVKKMQITWLDATGEFTRFEVLY